MNGQSILADNPVLRREARAFLRRAFILLPALLAVWVPLTWVTRIVVPQQIGANVSPMAAELIHALAMAFRPDVFIALFLVQRSASREIWHQCREELAVTFLSPARILAGKAFVPIALLAFFHAVGIWFYYGDLLIDPVYFVSFQDGGLYFPVGPLIMLLAFIEDLFFATVIVLIALRAYLFQPDAMQATLGAIVRLFLFGLAVCLCSWAWPLILNFLPIPWIGWMLTDFGRFLLLGNLVWFALILPLETILVALLWWKLTRKLSRWLQREPHGLVS